MDKFSLWIPVQPRAMKRPRVLASGRVYQPTSKTVRDIARYLHVSGIRRFAEELGNSPVSVFITVYLLRPKRTKFAHPTAQRHGDIDNHAKTVLDAIGQFIVVEIGENRIVLKKGKQKFELKLKKED